MTTLVFYLLVFDGDSPQDWRPFRLPIAELSESCRAESRLRTRETALLVARIAPPPPESLHDGTVGQAVGCLVDAALLAPERIEETCHRFAAFVERFVAGENFLEAVGFEIHAVGAPTDDVARGLQRLRLEFLAHGVSENLVRIDAITSDERFATLVALRAAMMSQNPKLGVALRRGG